MKLNQRAYSLGDLVYEIDSATKISQSNKLKKAWKGPYIITKILNPVLYQIKNTKEPRIVHHDRLKLCSDREVPVWVTRERHKLLENDSINTNDIVMKIRMIIKNKKTSFLGKMASVIIRQKLMINYKLKLTLKWIWRVFQNCLKKKMTEKQTKRGRKIRTPARFDNFEI